MMIDRTKPLFAWDCLEDSPSLKTIREFLAAVPDGWLLEGLPAWRGRGRNDYPVRVLWDALLLQIAVRHAHAEAMLAELKRNPAVRKLIGIEDEVQVPNGYNVSRFLAVLGQEPHRSELHRIFDAMVQKLGMVVADLGRDTAGDATALNARRQPKPLADDLPAPSGGRKEYTDDDGKVTKVVEWFGYKLHLLVDVKHEVALADEITSAKAGDGETLPTILHAAQANLPANRIKTLAYDKAAGGKVAAEEAGD
jgi:hypothetical protein